jgi:hypothetical protein
MRSRALLSVLVGRGLNGYLSLQTVSRHLRLQSTPCGAGQRADHRHGLCRAGDCVPRSSLEQIGQVYAGLDGIIAARSDD